MSQIPPRLDYVDYDPTYRGVATPLTQTIHSVLPQVTERVGSTSVPGLRGRSTLDCVLLSEPHDHGPSHQHWRQERAEAECPGTGRESSKRCQADILSIVTPPLVRAFRGR